MAKRYRSYYNRRKIDRKMMVFYFVCVIGLLFAILITTGKMKLLQEKLKEKVTGMQQSEEEETPLEIIDTVRVVLLSDVSGEYRNTVNITVKGTTTTYDNATWKETTNPLIITGDENGIIISAEKEANRPAYEGTIEIYKCDQGLVVVNEVPLDTYLEYVLPSEMPESFGLEALKAQAVCARSYVYVQAMENNYPEVNAQVDDSTAYQVYHHQQTNELSKQAVAETTGEILAVNNTVAEALYFSTSCGYTQDGTLFDEKHSYLTSHYVGDSQPAESFEKYIEQSDENAFEKNDKYFRWQVPLTTDIKDEKLGKLKKLKCIRRNDGGAIEELQLTFEKKKVTITGQLEVRTYLGKYMKDTTFGTGEVQKAPGEKGILYSSAFVWNTAEDGTITLYGGGFGHGCGMSQNGAKDMAALGYKYQDILSFYYQDVVQMDIGDLISERQ